jgi:MATE family multidrug resistance protein
VVGTGILRGMGRTRPAAAIYLVGYYVLALPMAWWLGFRLDLGLPGVWWGLCLGLASVAIMLVIWIWRRGPAKLPLASVLATEASAG